MKKFGILLLAVFILGIFCMGWTSNATAESLKIGYSMPAATHGYMARAIYWAKKGMADWKAKDPSLEFLFVTADNVTKQANDIEDLIQKGINALIVFPFDASVTSVVEKAYKAGIYVLVMDRGTSKPVYDMYLSNDDEGYTRTGMEWLSKQLDYQGNVVIIEGIPTPINTVRVDSIKKVAAQYPGVKILDSQPGDWNKQKALAVMENYLQKYKKIDAVYTADDDMMLGALQAYRESGRKDIKHFLGGGCDKNVIKWIMDDSHPLVKANVTYPPDQCATAVSLAVMGAQGKNFEGLYQKKLPIRIILSAELVTKANAEAYYFPEEP
ncbi:MAG: substrate-binding domain-containing protein [Desulfobacteraceae bacterium]|jgi:ribose transport system substrate-binding protein|nr:substrate-binding domain-containing protein [Desulfobacteraceae bacterium]